jgi:hypothetical protein
MFQEGEKIINSCFVRRQTDRQTDRNREEQYKKVRGDKLELRNNWRT